MTFSRLAAELAQQEALGLKRVRRALETPQSARVTVGGRDYLSFCSNDYLGLASDPRLVEAAQQGAARAGVGAGASHLVLGHSAMHEALEAALAEFVALPRALLFSTGYMANIGVVTALVGRDDAVYADRLNHASLNDACVLSRARFRRYPHGDFDVLEKQIRSTAARRRLIVTDAVFSMDGDVAVIPDLLALAERHDAWLLVDDAHGFGVLGSGGRGVLSHFGIASPRIVYMATLGKAAGVFGAFVAGAPTLVDYLVQRARAYIYTTATPPLLACAVLKSLELIDAEPWRQARLGQYARLLRQHLRAPHGRLMPSPSAIQPLVVGENAAATALADALAERGILVPAIRPPTVPQGTARLRISLSAAHREDDIARLVEALNGIAQR